MKIPWLNFVFLLNLEISAIKKILGFDTATGKIYTEDISSNIGYLPSPFKENMVISQSHWTSVMNNVEQPHSISNEHSNSFKVLTIGSLEVNGNFLMFVLEFFVRLFAFSIEKIYMKTFAQENMKKCSAVIARIHFWKSKITTLEKRLISVCLFLIDKLMEALL